MLHFSTVRRIFLREARDLLRDRRTLMIVLVLPALLYPAFVLIGLAFTTSLLDQKTVIGIVGADRLPRRIDRPESLFGGVLMASEFERRVDPPPILDGEGFDARLLRTDIGLGSLLVRKLDNDSRQPLDAREVDAIVIVPEGALEAIAAGKKPDFRILGRDGDETSKLAVRQAMGILARWREKLKAQRFAQVGLPVDYDQPLNIIDPDEAKPFAARTADELRDVLVKFLPFLLVMWTMAGALHPAVDLTAGEKERGTMETLLISPARRSEIVLGKFFAVFLASYLSSIWNLLWMAIGAVLLKAALPVSVLSFAGLAWTTLLAIPLAALFSSLALGLGAFARSSKEGQYYLLPLMMLTLPLGLWAMTPGLKLTPFLSAIPISGLSLILQNLLAVSGEPISLACWVLGLGSLFLCAALALRWAAWQFRNENVLFRGDDGFHLMTWIRSLRGN